MSTKQPASPVEMHCTTCGSTHVTRDAWAEWNPATQEWEVAAVFDLAWCHACDKQTQIEEGSIARRAEAASLRPPPLAQRH